MIKTALALASRGWRVLPCQPRSKEPATPHGVKDASTGTNIIKHWWGHRPDLNVAVATGRASDVFVIDIDSELGEAELRKLEAELGPLPPTVEVITPGRGGGRHLYFRMPPSVPVRNSTGRIAPGVDCKGDDGYCLVPPSEHPNGGVYSWSVDCAKAVADPPDWLLCRVVGVRANGGKVKAVSAEEWRTLIENGVDEGGRDCSVAKIAGHLLRRKIDPFVVLELMRSWNTTHCRPPLADSDIVRIVDSIAGKEIRRRCL